MFDIFPNGFSEGPYILIFFQEVLGANPVMSTTVKRQVVQGPDVEQSLPSRSTCPNTGASGT